MIERHSAGGIVLNPANQILLIEEENAFWCYPKGRLEPGEDMLTAAKREIYEETGVSELALIKELGTYRRPRVKHPEQMKVITLFLFHTTQTDLRPIDPKTVSAKWVDKTAVADLLTHPLDQQFFLSIADQI